MSLAVHIVTASLPPVTGGLERWTHDLAEHLSAGGTRVAAYVCHSTGGGDNGGRYRVVDIAALRRPWEAPLKAAATTRDRISRERARLNAILLRSEIGREVAAHPALRHCILSNFAIGIGHHAMVVARELGLPHVAMVVGSDYSRGFRNPLERSVLRELCATAACIVCRSSEQALALRRDMGPARLEILPTPVSYPARPAKPARRSRDVRLFADCGASYQKGTSVLLDAFGELRSAGRPVSLELCGPINVEQEQFWTVLLARTARRAGKAFKYLGYIDRDQVYERLNRASIYCSATLGEGSSAARLAALCSGIPMVTTRCGEFALDIRPMSHVRIADVGSADGFKAELGALVAEVETGSLVVDWTGVAEARARYASADRWSPWTRLFRDLTAAG